jgi:hypothetical protein
MAKNATLFIDADVPMHNRRESGYGQYCHHHQQA